MTAQAKTINLLLYSGTLQGIISLEDSGWNAGTMYVAPRDSVEDLLETEACRRYGVYLLLANDKVYIGQSSDLAKRLSQHVSGKDWWDSVVILTTTNDSLDHTDIDFLESRLIGKALSATPVECDNKNKGNPPKVNKFREVWLDQYLNEALFLMELIGIKPFSRSANRGSHKHSEMVPTLANLTVKDRLALGMRNKTDALELVKERGVKLGKVVSYSTLQKNGEAFWINPKTHVLATTWNIVLNDTQVRELVVLKLPPNTVALQSDNGKGLRTRSDKPELISLMIERETLVDRNSGFSFSPYLVARVPY